MKPMKSTTKHCFELITPLRTYCLYSDSSAVMKEWIDILQQKINQDFESLLSSNSPNSSFFGSSSYPNTTTNQSSPILKEGNLFKKGALTFEKKYVVLRGHHLNFYESKGDAVPVASVNILTCNIKEDVKVDKKKFFFDVITPSKTVHLYTESKAETDSWITEIKTAAVQFMGGMKAEVTSLASPKLSKSGAISLERSDSTADQLHSLFKEKPALISSLLFPTNTFQTTFFKMLTEVRDKKTSIETLESYCSRNQQKKGELESLVMQRWDDSSKIFSSDRNLSTWKEVSSRLCNEETQVKEIFDEFLSKCS